MEKVVRINVGIEITVNKPIIRWFSKLSIYSTTITPVHPSNTLFLIILLFLSSTKWPCKISREIQASCIFTFAALHPLHTFTLWITICLHCLGNVLFDFVALFLRTPGLSFTSPPLDLGDHISWHSMCEWVLLCWLKVTWKKTNKKLIHWLRLYILVTRVSSRFAF